MNVLIIGYGHMGKRYGKYLTSFKYEWSYFDPYVRGGKKDLKNINQYTHIIISTPPEQHYDSYKKLNDFKGFILIDKPVITSKEHLPIFKDNRTFYSLTERFNPAVQKLKSCLDLEKVISINFVRNSNVNAIYWDIPILFNLGIHDLDLYFYLTGDDKIPKILANFSKSKTHFLDTVNSKNILTQFMWSHECKKIERRIKVYQTDTVYVADLVDQTVIKYENDNRIIKLGLLQEQPIRAQLYDFLNNTEHDRSSSNIAHAFMIDLFEK